MLTLSGMALILVIACGAALAWIYDGPRRAIADKKLHGFSLGNQEWSGTITLTGDTTVIGNLWIKPGTKVLFEVGDDQGTGDEIQPDGYNDADPTRLSAYTKSHSALIVLGVLIAKGSSEKQIIFTSASSNPTYADWESICFSGSGSQFEYVLVEYARNGINPMLPHQKFSVRNSLFRHNYWSGLSLSRSDAEITECELSDSGHEGIDLQSGNCILKNNTIRDCHAGIVILAGHAVIEGNKISDCGAGIHIGDNATATLSNNEIRLASPYSKREWRYKNHAYAMFASPPPPE